MSDDILGLLEAYWQSKCHDGQLPSRKDIDPAEIRRLLAHIALIDVVTEGDGFRFRLVGTKVVRQLSYDPTGQQLSEGAATGKGTPFWEFLTGIVRDRCRGSIELPYFGTNVSFGSIRIVGLPLVAEGAIDKILLGFSFAGATDYQELKRCIQQ
jgi:hypothetical protein